MSQFISFVCVYLKINWSTKQYIRKLLEDMLWQTDGIGQKQKSDAMLP